MVAQSYIRWMHSFECLPLINCVCTVISVQVFNYQNSQTHQSPTPITHAMSTNLLGKLLPGVVCPTSLFTTCIRLASKGNRACRQDGQQKGQEYGWKLHSGQMAKEGQLLYKQRVPRFHPGLNVIVSGEKLSLHAACPGKVLVTREKVHLNYDNKKIAPYYAKRDMSAVYKKYYHVIPKPQHNEFQLVAEI
ncbi:uncharacterized protein LOC111268618 isoform X2 [Varroa jacobsoni]|uniref:uncharacterized protein LOC111268618 isoform X2 n=1 Tax=Varroa jacobsoni TaxID=62625 RepID=UPI000BFA3461|nr:uncharacterized protein LOC111268618 isoform X2 [Varroa jacobsoni]